MYKKTRVRVVILCGGIQGKPVSKPHGNEPWGFILAVEHCRGTILKPFCVPCSLLYCLTLNVYAHTSDQMKKDTAARMQNYYDNLTAKKA